MHRLALLVSVLLLTACSSLSVGTKQELGPKMAASKIYSRGTANLKSRNFDAAIQEFENLEIHYPYGSYSDKGQLAIIYAFYQKDDTAQAIAAANRFIQIRPQHPNVDYAYYMRGMAYYKDNFSYIFRNFPVAKFMRDPTEAKHAFNSFKLLLQKYPNSSYNTDARSKMVIMKNQIAAHELEVAKFYHSKQAYVAAVSRLNNLLVEFDESSSIPGALQLLQKCYVALDKPELSKKALDLQEKLMVVG